jgi:cell division cycle 20-like protein 1 (cofactor of APC complex)
MIFNHDIRASTHYQATLQGHRREVCGLKWSPDGKQLVCQVLIVQTDYTYVVTDLPQIGFGWQR